MQYIKTDLILRGKTYNNIPYTIKCNTSFLEDDRVKYIEIFQDCLNRGKDIIHEIVKTQCYEFHMNWRRVSKIAWIEKAEKSLIIYQIFSFKDLCKGYDLHFKELWEIIKENKDMLKIYSENNEWYISIRPNMFDLFDEVIKSKIEESDSNND